MRQFLISMYMILACSISVHAADPVEHVVERGETLSSIARQYSISEKALTDANPDAANLFYAGMVLTIPASHKATTTVTDNALTSSGQKESYGENEEKALNNMSNSTAKSSYARHNETIHQGNTNTLTASRFSNLSLTYAANFKSFDHGSYGISMDSYRDSGFGVVGEIKANYGLVKPGNIGFYFGPAYGYPVTEYFMPAIKVKGYIQTEEVQTGYSIAGDHRRDDSSLTVGGGILFTPTINFRFGRLVVGVGYDLGFYSVRGVDPASYVSGGSISYAPALTQKRINYSSQTVKYDRKQSTGFNHMFEIQIGIYI